MNIKTTIFALLAIASAVALGEDWTYDNGSLTDGVWTFGASKSGTAVGVGYATSGPSEVTALDFTKPVKDTDGNELYFSGIGPRMNENSLHSYVGELSLPESGYTSLGYDAFSGCANATGTITLSPDLTSLGGGTFNNCSGVTIVGSSFPEGLTAINRAEFKNCKIQGDLLLTSITTINQNAFAGTDVGSVTFGPGLATVLNATTWGSIEGVFSGCSSLSNVTFNASSSASITGGYMFNGCTSLREIDMTGVTSIAQDADNIGHFRGCTALAKVTFGGNMTLLDGRIFNGATALTKVIFNGPPPTTITNTWLYGAGSGEVTTYVILDEDATDYDYATAKAAWDALTAGGEINDSDSTWAESYVGEGMASTRHLLLYSVPKVSITANGDADEGNGVAGGFTVSRAEGDSIAAALEVNYTVGGTATAGQTYATLSGSVTIPAGSQSVAISVMPMDDPSTTEDTTVTLTLAAGEYEIVEGSESATVTVVNGESFGGWTYAVDAGTVSKGGWTFNATYSGSSMTIGSVVAYPESISPLDLSGVVVGTDGSSYVIVNLNPAFGNQDAAVRDLVGTLTLPGEGLKTISANAFLDCTNMNGRLDIPASVTSIGAGAFGRNDYDSAGFTDLTGDLVLTNIVELSATALNKTKITSVRFGPSLQRLVGGWYRSGLSGCTCLTNVVFDPESKVNMVWAFNFSGCTALTDLDLSCVTNIANAASDFPGTHFVKCTALTNITFGADLLVVPTNIFTGATALQSVHFKGAAPIIGDGNGGLFTDVTSGQTIKTYVSLKYAAVKNSAGLSWNDYVDGGVLGKTSSYWKSDYLYSGADKSYFPLLREDSSGFVIIVK